MLTLLGNKEEDNAKTSTEYYYTQPNDHYYCPGPFNNDLNNFHHPSIYETNNYYTFSPNYPQLNHHHHHPNEENSNSPVSNSVYRPTYPYSSEGHTNEIFYSQKSSDPQITPVYDYNISSISTVSSNPIFHQNSNYAQSSVNQAHCSADYLTAYSPLDGACRSDSIIVELANRPLWLKFAPHTHENVVTKPGRRMFPTLEFKVYGLKPESIYNIYVDMVLIDANHWKFNSGKWIPSGQVEKSSEKQINLDHHYFHPDSPNSGAYWMKTEKISFSKLKLTNNKQLSTSQRQHKMTVMLNSMHKYMPRLNIVEITGQSNKNIEPSKHMFTFPETQFIAVTAYQNTDITQLKIDNNPFAKGFRDSSDNRNIYNSYSYGSPSPPYASGSNMGFDCYENTYQHHKKKRHY